MLTKLIIHLSFKAAATLMNITIAYVTPQATHAHHEVKAYAINNTRSVTRIKLLSTTL